MPLTRYVLSEDAANDLIDAAIAAAVPDPLTVVDLLDDFVTGGSTSGLIGALPWTFVGGSTDVVAAEAGHPGFARRNTSSSINTIAYTSLRNNATVGGSFHLTESFDLTFIFRLNHDDADTNFRIGLSSNWTAQNPVEGAYLELLGTDTNWFFITRHTSTETPRTDSGVAANTSWHKLRLRRIDASTLGFTLDAGSEVSVTTNLPTGGTLQPGWHITNLAAAIKTVDVDFFRLTITGLGR